MSSSELARRIRRGERWTIADDENTRCAEQAAEKLVELGYVWKGGRWRPAGDDVSDLVGRLKPGHGVAVFPAVTMRD